MSTPTPFESEMLQMMRAMQADVWELKTDVWTLKSDVSVLKSDVSVLKSDVSELKSDVSVLKSDVSVLKSDMIEVKGRLHHMEVWNDKAFEAIEELSEEVQREGAATRAMMYQSSNDMFQLRDRLDTAPRSSRSSRSRVVPA
jgi:chromosome segregation ATPase